MNMKAIKVLCTLCLLLCGCFSTIASGSNPPVVLYKISLPIDDSKPVVLIRVHAGKKAGNISVRVKNKEARQYEFYLFNSDGRLVNNTRFSGGEQTLITQPANGLYTYELFCKDERIGRGQVLVRQ
jgi:uncharacterized protein YcfL